MHELQYCATFLYKKSFRKLLKRFGDHVKENPKSTKFTKAEARKWATIYTAAMDENQLFQLMSRWQAIIAFWEKYRGTSNKEPAEYPNYIGG
jgi:hypothetical protein